MQTDRERATTNSLFCFGFLTWSGRCTSVLTLHLTNLIVKSVDFYNMQSCYMEYASTSRISHTLYIFTDTCVVPP